MTENKSDIENLTFEEALRQLEDTVDQLEVGDMSLEESLALYERGQKLASYCGALLDKASLRVELLSADGEIVDISDQEM